MSLTFSDHLVDPFEEVIDLLVRFGELQDTSGLVARRLTRQRWAICASPDALARFGTPQTLEELTQHLVCALAVQAARAFNR